MNRPALARVIRSVVALAMLAVLPRSTAASPISLDSALSGTAFAGQLFELTASFSLNGAASNLVGQELYIDFAGLSVVGGSYQLGSVYTPFGPDLLTLDGDCAVIGCSDPGGPPSLGSRYLSLVSAFAPAAPTGPGALFTLQFLATGAPWSLNLIGDSDYSLLSDPVLDGAIAPMPFAIVSGNTAVSSGTAVVSVNLTAQTEVARVPEPSTMLLTVMGLAFTGLATRRRRTSQAQPPRS